MNQVDVILRMIFALYSNQFSHILVAISSNNLIKHKTLKIVSFSMETADLEIGQLVYIDEEIVYFLV